MTIALCHQVLTGSGRTLVSPSGGTRFCTSGSMFSIRIVNYAQTI